MKGDFTRSTFQPEKHYTSVRMQQGRLQLDSDWNEQVDIEAYLRHAQSVDMIGADSGVPTSGGDSGEPYRDSFKISITPDGSDLAIAPGRLYVNGTLCELETGTHFKAKIKASNRVEVSSLIVDGHPLEQGQWLEYPTQGKEKQPQWLQIKTVTSNQLELTFTNVKLKDLTGAKTEEDFVGKEIQLRRLLTYSTQPDYPNPNGESTLIDGVYVAYIDVWQRHITAIEDSTIREVALNIPDTTTRTKTVWQLKLKKLDNLEEITGSDKHKKEWEDFFNKQKIERRKPYLNACAKYCSPSGSSTSAETGYRRLENQLYRVEIHDPSPKATFKWSRDNGNIVSAIKNIQGNTIIIRKTSQDAWTSSQTGQWIEITNEEMELKGKPGALAPLLRASDTKIEFDTSRITNGEILSKATKVRRWEQIKEIVIANQSDQAGWVDLEDGIKVQFDKDSIYETGDYWLIPARSATNDIEWPNDQAKPIPQPLPQSTQGIYHNYCLLALVELKEGKLKQPKDQRVIFPPLMRCLDRAGGIITGSLVINGSIKLSKGAIVDEFSTDTKLSHNKERSVPTVRAVKTYIDDQINPLKVTLETKANKSEVDKQIATVNSTLETKADKSEVDKQIATVNSTLETKADKSEVDKQIATVNSTLETKADKSEVDKQIATVNSTLETKADKSEVDKQIATVNSTLETKADKSEVDKQIATVNSTLETKADKSEVDKQIATVNSTLETKADKSEVDKQIATVNSTLETKADKSEVDKQIATVNSTLETKANQNGDSQQDFNSKVFTAEELKVNKLTQNSSRTLKNEINELSSQEVAKMLKELIPVKFVFAEDDLKTPHAGFIAENTPDLLTANDKQTIKVVDIVAVLTKVVQDNRKTLTTLVKVVKNQQAEIAALTEKLKTLEGKIEQ